MCTNGSARYGGLRAWIVLLWTKTHVPHRLVCRCLICVAVAVAGGIWEVIRSWGSVLVMRFMSLKVKHAKARFPPPSAVRICEKMAIYKGEEEKMGVTRSVSGGSLTMDSLTSFQALRNKNLLLQLQSPFGFDSSLR